MLGKRGTPFRILYAFNRKDKEFMDKLFILNYVKVLWTGCLRKGMEEAQKEGKSSRGMYMCNIADITPKWKDIRIVDIIPNGSYLCSNADIPKLSEIVSKRLIRMMVIYD